MSDLPFTLDQLKILQMVSNQGSFKKLQKNYTFLNQLLVYKFKAWKSNLILHFFTEIKEKQD